MFIWRQIGQHAKKAREKEEAIYTDRTGSVIGEEVKNKTGPAVLQRQGQLARAGEFLLK